MIATQPRMPRIQVMVSPTEPWAPPPSSWKVGSRPVTAAPCDWYQTRPRIESRPPRVTMNDGTPMYAMMNPWRAPIAAPMPIPKARASAHWNGTSGPIPKMCGNQSVMSSA